MAEACCDIQCFYSNNAYLIKELALTSLDGSIVEHYIFRAPFPFHDLDLKDQQTNAYLTRNKHCLNWYAGVVNYSQLPLILERIGREYAILYTKGKQKQDCLQNYVSRACLVVDLESRNCPSLLDLSIYPAARCYMNHPSCALTNCVRMREWMDADLNKGVGSLSISTSRSPDCAFETRSVNHPVYNNELFSREHGR